MINVSFRFAYLLLCIPFVVVWVLIFIFRKDTHKEQLAMSYKAAILGPLSEIIYFRDYWIPESVFSFHIGRFPFMIEDVIFGFVIGGISSVIFEIVFREKLSKFSLHAKYAISTFSILFIFMFVLSMALSFGFNSIYASSIAFVAAAIPIIYFRHDLFLNAIGSGLCVMLVMFVSYTLLLAVVLNADELLRRMWLLYDTRLGVRVAGVPLTEMVWGFTLGFVAGPWYEFTRKKKDIAIS